MHGHRLRTLNLDDNLVSSLSEIENLKELSFLTELSFRSKQTDNPVCRNLKYASAVLACVPQLEIFDGQPLARRLEEGKSAANKLSPSKTRVSEPKALKEPPVKENENPNEKKSSHQAQEELRQILQNVFHLFTEQIG